MKKFPQLKCLDMNLIKHQIFYLPEAKTRLESLCELKCDTSIDPSYFYGLASICQYIQRLIITVNTVSKPNSGIAKLIEVQKNLKYFEWTDDVDDDYFTDNPYKEIFLELEKKAGSLNHLKLFFLFIDSFDYTTIQSLFPKLHNIKTLKTNEFYFIGFTADERSMLNTLVYNDLEILNIDYISIGHTSTIIENSGGHLKEVSLKPYDFIISKYNFSDESLIFIRNIYENCPLIEYLSLVLFLSRNHFIEFEKLLQVCQNLKLLLLITSNNYMQRTDEEILEDRKELLKILIKSAPTNLREIRFFDDFDVSLEVLEEFFEKWRGRPALSILTSNSIYEGKFPQLKCLDMNLIKHQIFYLPEAKTRLESLCELKCDTSIDPSYFYGLASICQYIQRLIITVNTVSKPNSGIAKLIEVQKNLKYFEWTDDVDDDYFTDNPYKEIFLELEKKAGSLNHLKLFFLFIDSFDYTTIQSLFPKLHNIKTLKTNEFYFIGFTADERSMLNTLVYNDLEILNIDYISIGHTSTIIENSGGHLKEVSLKPYDFIISKYNFSDESLIFIRNIYENCPLIEYLSLVLFLSRNHFIEFEKLLQVCQNLKLLLLITSNNYMQRTDEEILEDRKELLKILIKSAPTNLREIRFFDDFDVSLEVLEEFFEKWRGRPALSILTSNSIYEGVNYKNLINKYKNNGVIKSFKYVSDVYVEDMNYKI
ncbi:unnamed protein product [Rhizophagus irregularis]|nr:unnamed protein product [Rhizophagus irregularis]